MSSRCVLSLCVLSRCVVSVRVVSVWREDDLCVCCLGVCDLCVCCLVWVVSVWKEEAEAEAAGSGRQEADET